MYKFPVVYLIDEELEKRFVGREGDLAWLRQHLNDPACVVFNAPRPLLYEYSRNNEDFGRSVPGAPVGYFVAVVFPARDKWNADCVKLDHENRAHVLRLVTQAQARQMVIDDLPEQYRDAWLSDGLVDKHWRQSFDNRFDRDEIEVEVFQGVK